MSKYRLIIFFCLIFRFSFSQEPLPLTEQIKTIAEQLASLSDENADIDELTDDLEKLYLNPVDINKADITQLEQLPFLNEFQIKSLLDYIAENGPLLSIYELPYIYGFDPEFVVLIEPFIKIENVAVSKPFKKSRNTLLLRTQTLVETPVGYKAVNDSLPKYYKGNKWKYYTKYKFENNRIKTGFMAEKDPGEPFFTSPNRQGFDFYSFYTQYNSEKWGITAGDFSVCYGQGLILWTRYSFSKGVDATGIRKRNQGIHPYSSADENTFFRGLAGEYKTRHFATTLFVSAKPLDATLTSDSTGKTYISSFQVSGIHASESQLKTWKSAWHKAAGSSIHYLGDNFRTGLNFYTYQYNNEVLNGNKPYQKYNFSGLSGANLSADATMFYRSFTGFAEVATSHKGKMAFTAGIINRLSDAISLSVILRHFDKAHTAEWSKPFAENSKSQNESGIYLGIQIIPYKYITITGYFDQYRFPWLRYNLPKPSAGYDCMAQIKWLWGKNTEIIYRASYQENTLKTTYTSLFSQYDFLPANLFKSKLEINQKPNANLKLKTRFDYVKYLFNKKTNEGFYLFQDIGYTFEKMKLTLWLHYGLFETSDYNARIYAYEYDVLYGFSVPAISGEGSRSYLLVEYQPTNSTTIWFRIGQFNYADRKITGSGHDQISGNTKTEIKLQAIFRF